MTNNLIKIIRSFCMVLAFILFGIGAVAIRYCIFPFQKNKLKNYETLQKSWQFFIWLLKTVKMIRIEINGLEDLKKIQGSIIVSTHPSFIDIVILMSIIPHSTCFVADRLAKNPFLKGIVKHLFILEGQPINSWKQQACNMLENNLNIIIFPMGIRHRKSETPKIRRGVSLIAFESKKNISMVKMETDFDFLQINQPFYKAGEKPVKYTIEYLGEIDTSEYLYLDEVSFKTAITKNISNKLYNL